MAAAESRHVRCYNDNVTLMVSLYPASQYEMIATHHWLRFFLVFSLLLGCCQATEAAEKIDFQEQILPLLYNRCFSCHSEKTDKPRANLLLDSAEAIRASGVIVPGKPTESEFVKRISLQPTDDGHMPPIKGGSQPFNETERELLRRWIENGASTGSWQKFNHREPPRESPGPSLSRAAVPELSRQLDKIIATYHQAQGTELNPLVSDDGFVRRVYLDLAGRIPSLAESNRFLADRAPNKRAKLIDELLDSEAYVSHTFNWKADQLRLVTKGFPGLPGWMYDEWVRDSIRSGMKYDEFVRQLLTAKGYLWDNGAVGFYLRDLGMPLDHMSNLSRLFLGTRIECAQCHDHPYEPVTQRDFYQLTAFTFGVSNLYTSAGFSTDNVQHWKELQTRLKEMNASEGLRQNVSSVTAPLKRLTRDTDHLLCYPDNYANDASLRRKPVEIRTPFGEEAIIKGDDRRAAFATWMTSPRNPRFTKNIVNRLWKRVMGVGLIEPVDSLSPVTRAEQPEVLEFLTRSMIQLGFDERALLAVVANSRAYQSEAVRKELEPGAPLKLVGPMLRRLSAEQLWDSLLTLLVVDLDARQPERLDQGFLSREQLTELSQMSAEQLLVRAQAMMTFREQQRAHNIAVANFKSAIQKAKDAKDVESERRLQKEYAAANDQFEQIRQAARMENSITVKESDARWKKLPPGYVRAAEIPTPLPLGHFLRQFGQSDRREIDAFNKQANITHSLAFMNGELTKHAMQEDSYLRKSLHAVPAGKQRISAIYQAILIRQPTDIEHARCDKLFATSESAEADLIWALLNSPEFLFIQ